jgi:hypothetical protein
MEMEVEKEQVYNSPFISMTSYVPVQKEKE